MADPTLPTDADDSPEAVQLDRKQRLAAALRLISRFGLDFGVAGHVTVRDPIDTSTFWVNPMGLHFSRMRVSDLIRVDTAGTVVEGDGPLNAAAFAIHSEVHRARPDVMAAAHSHSPYGVAWSVFGRLLEPLSQDACSFYDDHAVFSPFTGVVYSPEEGARLARTLGDRKALILQHHGLLTVGATVDEAAWWFISMERACQIQLAVEAAGAHDPIDAETARLTAGQMGSPESGRLSFLPLYQRILAEQPDLLD
ncbi:MAG: class II aldolase/adducin family protein [Acidimicrobiales bacterium]|nr:class II aldolase/adducin family protein [Acidimicrobiales bacterium]